jgi:magnesium chelatase family protein
VEIIRGQRALAFPARVMLVAACNPCPCARGREDCRCNELDRMRYARRLSGPLLDRIDLICEVQTPPAAQLVDRAGTAEPSAAVRERVVAARERQARRLAGDDALCNGHMDGRSTRRHAVLGSRGTERLLGSVEAGTLTGRGHDRVLRLARTLADLAGRERVTAEDVEEAVGYRLVSPVETAA